MIVRKSLRYLPTLRLEALIYCILTHLRQIWSERGGDFISKSKFAKTLGEIAFRGRGKENTGLLFSLPMSPICQMKKN